MRPANRPGSSTLRVSAVPNLKSGSWARVRLDRVLRAGDISFNHLQMVLEGQATVAASPAPAELFGYLQQALTQWGTQ